LVVSKGKSSNDRNMHHGHRDRMRDRFISEGLDNFEPHLILELILYYAIPQKDTNTLAHLLLDRFDGSLMRVLDAPVEELMMVHGIGKNAAVLIKMFPEVCRRYLLETSETGKIVKNSEDAVKHLLPIFFGKSIEHVVLMCMDARGRVVFCNTVFEGSVNAAAVSVRRVVEICVRYATTDVIMAHNHPGGIAIPSEQDVMVTKRVADALKMVGVRLLDHLIIAGNDWVSLAATPTLSDIFEVSNGFF
jgi:DNA repair protein RadC